VLTFTTAQFDAWLGGFLWPLTRILAVLSVAPLIGQARVPMRVRVALGLVITIAVAPMLPPLPPVAPNSAAGTLILLTQAIIGLAVGFAMRLVFAAIEMAGDVAGTQMGLGFALFFDPGNVQHTPLLGQFLGLVATLTFVSLNGHLMIIATLADSFRLIPIAAGPLPGSLFETLARYGAMVFAAALQLSLPLVMTMLVVNLALGVLTRAAPQLNIFAVGFPVTLAIGFGALLLALPFFAPVFERLFHETFRFVGTLAVP
jgi:flagellar biosynthetic protein FliR